MVHRYTESLYGSTYGFSPETGDYITIPTPKRYPHIIETFDSLNEFYTEAVRLCNPNRTYIAARTERDVRDGVMHSKVPSILEIVSEAIKISPELRDIFSFTPQFDVAGDYVDVGRFVEGEPECMVAHPMRINNAVSPVITLVSSADANIGGDWTTRGIIATALGMAISRLGYNTEMWSDNYGSAGGTFQYQRMRIKSTSDEINPARLMFGFGDKRMLTELAFANFSGMTTNGFPEFAAWERTNGSARQRSAAVEALYPPGTIFITGKLSGGSTPAEMAAVITGELRKAGLLK